MPLAVLLRQVVMYRRRGEESLDVLHGRRMETPQGEFVSPMGPSGSGESAILSLAECLHRLEMSKGLPAERFKAAA